jgi:hypothetical protein
MGDPLHHSISSANKFGGVPDDYIRIHAIMDSSKLFLADWRHRALLHNTFGIYLFEQLLGPSFKRASDGVDVCTRTVVTEHIMEDLKAVPTPGEFLREMPIKRWMAGITKSEKNIMQNLTIEGDGTKEAYIASNIIWNLNKNNKPDKTDYYLVAWAGTGATSTAKYDINVKKWLNSNDVQLNESSIEYWATMPLNPSAI